MNLCSYSSTNTLPSTVTEKWGAASFFQCSERRNEESEEMKKVRYGPAQKKSKGVLTQSQPLPSVFPFVNHFFSLFRQLQKLLLDLDGEQRAGLLHKNQAAAPPNPSLTRVPRKWLHGANNSCFSLPSINKCDISIKISHLHKHSVSVKSYNTQSIW